VVDLDDTAPTVTSDSASQVGSIVENTGAGQVVFQAVADDSSDESDGVSFSLTGVDADKFDIDASSGAVTLIADADADAQSQYNFTVVATDAADNSSEISHILNVTDLDEIAPQFTTGSDASIVENSGAGQVVYRAEATDGSDTPDGITYSLSSNGNEPELVEGVQTVFVSNEVVNPNLVPNQLELTVTYLADSNELPGLGLNIHFDSSQLSYVDMQEVLAKDLVFNGLVSDDASDLDGNASTDTYVSVAWASLYGDWTSTGLPEDLLTIVFDIDDSSSTEIGFSSSSTPVNYEFNGLGYDALALSIDEVTGDVTLNTNPDYETQSEYSFTVNATDGVFSVDQDVTLSVINVDDTGPSITSGAIAVSVDENSGGKVVYSAQADDSADVSQGAVTYSLANGHDAAIEISAETGDVYLLEDPDHESQSSYSFTVIATDSTGREISKDVNLTINDLDDTAPTINSGDSAGAIDENTGSSQVIYTATADDTSDVSDGVSFSLTEGSDSALSINSETGAVTLSVDPNYEAQSEYSFGVIATDAAGNSSEQSVSLSINDIVESGPTITSGSIAATIDEANSANQEDASGQVVYTVTSVGPSATYSLDGVDADKFSIDANTGVVTLVGNPDFEAQSQYSFTVVATGGPLSVSNSQEVTLSVDNLDEVAPTITSADTANTVEAGYVGNIYTATATDSDVVSDGVSYGLANSERTDLSIDSATGVVSLDESADSAGYNFTVVASDVAGNTSSQNVSMDVYETVSGSQPDDASAAISQVYTHNADGSITLNLVFNSALASEYIADANIAVDSIENIDFDLSHGTGISITSIQDTQALLSFENEVGPDSYEVSQIYFDLVTWTGADLDGVSLLEITFDLELGVESGFTVSNASINADTSVMSDDGVTSSIDVNVIQGTNGDDIFELGGGFTNIYTGEGIDTLIVTDQVDASVVVDFDSGSDKFDMTQLLSNAESEFGGSFDDETNVLTFTVDNNAVAEVTLSEGSEFDEDDLSADLSAFIA
jgi:hypothetical protein